MKCIQCGAEYAQTRRQTHYPPDELSHRQAEVAYMAIRGMGNREISDKLFISEKTVKYHTTDIYKKLNINGRQQLISGWHEGTLPEKGLPLIVLQFEQAGLHHLIPRRKDDQLPAGEVLSENG